VGDPDLYGGDDPATDNPTIDSGTLGFFQTSFNASRLVSHDEDFCNNYEPTYPANPWWLDADYNEARPTWVYITADVAAICNKDFPNSSTYWGAGGFGNTLPDNVLMGDWYTYNSETTDATAMQAVALEADVDISNVLTWRSDAGNDVPLTFFNRYSNGTDYREPLGTAWAFRYSVANGFNTKIRVFKNAEENPWIPDLGIVYDSTPANPSELIAKDCLAYTYYSWDEDEQVQSGSGGGSDPYSGGGTYGDRNLIPLETQEVDVSQFHIAPDSGWMLFVWPASNYANKPDSIVDHYYQTWMGPHYTFETGNGLMSEGMNATLMANYNCFSDQVLPNLGIDYDYVNIDGYVVPVGNIPPMK